jgi:hypothetical protein
MRVSCADPPLSTGSGDARGTSLAESGSFTNSLRQSADLGLLAGRRVPVRAGPHEVAPRRMRSEDAVEAHEWMKPSAEEARSAELVHQLYCEVYQRVCVRLLAVLRVTEHDDTDAGVDIEERGCGDAQVQATMTP